MAYDPLYHHRRSTRLPSFDYAGNATYFVTLCALGRKPVFGFVEKGQMRLSPAGQLATCAWLDSPSIRPTLSLDAFVVMPNHLHGIVLITPEPPAGEIGRTAVRPYQGDSPAGPDRMFARKQRSLGSFVAQFKATTTRAINVLDATEAGLVWQRGFHEHVIRHDADLDRIRAYIASNPSRWSDDSENPRQ